VESCIHQPSHESMGHSPAGRCLGFWPCTE
jgi:hypothetical protein